jgi:hypothetical protein
MSDVNAYEFSFLGGECDEHVEHYREAVVMLTAVATLIRGEVSRPRA